MVILYEILETFEHNSEHDQKFVVQSVDQNFLILKIEHLYHNEMAFKTVFHREIWKILSGLSTIHSHFVLPQGNGF